MDTQLTKGDWVVITLEGEIDLSRFDELVQRLDRDWSAGHDLLVDLTSVTFIDSSGLRWLLTAKTAVVEAERQFAIIIPDGGHVERLLAIAGLEKEFLIYRNLDRLVERLDAGETVLDELT